MLFAEVRISNLAIVAFHGRTPHDLAYENALVRNQIPGGCVGIKVDRLLVEEGFDDDLDGYGNHLRRLDSISLGRFLRERPLLVSGMLSLHSS